MTTGTLDVDWGEGGACPPRGVEQCLEDGPPPTPQALWQTCVSCGECQDLTGTQAPSHTCTQVHAHAVAYVCMHAKCALTSPTTHVRMCSRKFALCNVTVPRKQTSSSQSPRAHPVLPTSLPASHADLPPPRRLPAEREEAQAPLSPGGFHFLARKVQGWVRCSPLHCELSFPSPHPARAGVSLGGAEPTGGRVPGQRRLTVPGGPWEVLRALHILQRGPVSSRTVHLEKTPSV